MKVTPVTLKTPDGRNVWLTIGREYDVLGIEGKYFRILTDKKSDPWGNDPVLFESECFIVTDPHEPDFWECKVVEGERYYYPPEWFEEYFFEDYHDGIEEVRKQFWSDLKRYYPETWCNAEAD
jgi:hypothetical protein